MIFRRGQIAIFVIIALIIMVSIAIVFVFQKRISLEKQDDFSPQNYMQQCIRNTVDTAIRQMLPQGGFIEPQNHILYNGEKIEYLCFNRGNFGTCVMQHPTYLKDLENEINNYALPYVAGCYDALETELEKRQTTVRYGDLEINSSVIYGKVRMNVNRSVTLERDGSIEEFNSFSIETRSELYDLAKIAIEIANQENQYCYFSYDGYMLLHQQFDISKDVLSDDTRIYSISDIGSGEKLNIAIRGCSIPAGL